MVIIKINKFISVYKCCLSQIWRFLQKIWQVTRYRGHTCVVSGNLCWIFITWVITDVAVNFLNWRPPVFYIGGRHSIKWRPPTFYIGGRLYSTLADAIVESGGRLIIVGGRVRGIVRGRLGGWPLSATIQTFCTEIPQTLYFRVGRRETTTSPA